MGTTPHCDRLFVCLFVWGFVCRLFFFLNWKFIDLLPLPVLMYYTSEHFFSDFTVVSEFFFCDFRHFCLFLTFDNYKIQVFRWRKTDFYRLVSQELTDSNSVHMEVSLKKKLSDITGLTERGVHCEPFVRGGDDQKTRVSDGDRDKDGCRRFFRPHTKFETL